MIPFDLEEAIVILGRTPAVLESLLSGIPPAWALNNEGGNSWSPFNIINHLIECERTNWIPRITIILSDKPDKRYTPFDRSLGLNDNRGSSMSELTREFGRLRAANLDHLRSMDIQREDLFKTGIHPEFGTVTLGQQIATWTAHDLSHLLQITRVMTRQYREAIGPWVNYLTITRQ